MASNRKECLDDALKNLSATHKTMHEALLKDLAITEGHADQDHRQEEVQKLLAGIAQAYRLAEEAYQGEVEACKREYPT